MARCRTCWADRRRPSCPRTPSRRALADGVIPARSGRRSPGVVAAVGGARRAEPAAAEPVTAYAYARTGYHRGLDALRRNGWKGHGPVPWEHEPNRGFLRALHALGQAAAAIGETDEAERCATFLRQQPDGGGGARRPPGG